jgi:hypothetical protein
MREIDLMEETNFCVKLQTPALLSVTTVGIN